MEILNIRILIAVLLVTILFASCKDDDQPMIDVPANYTFERDNLSTISFSGQTTRIAMAEELIAALVDFDQSAAGLAEMFTNETAGGEDANPFVDQTLNDSDKSVRSKVAASHDYFSANTVAAAAIKAEFDAWINNQVAEVFVNENELAVSGTAGQIADGSKTRWVNSDGLEYNQVLAKSLIGALMVDQMLNNYLSPGVLDEGENIADNDAMITADGEDYTNMEHKWDEAYGYLFGAASDGANPLATLGSDDSFLNEYLGRVEDDSDFAGIADDIFEAFKYGRAAIEAGEYGVRDMQSEIIQEKISLVLAVRGVFYLQAGKTAIEAGANGTAFHALSEAYGFIYSLQFTRKPRTDNPYFQQSDVKNMLTDLLDDGVNGLWSIQTETLDSISETIASEFGFTVAQAKE